MAGTITHSWDGTVLTVTSDSGSSSMDLKGSRGDVGPRGAQGPAGISIGAEGTVDLTGYATEEYVNNQINNAEFNVNLDDYYTKSQVNAIVANVEPDLTGYATETFVTNKIAEAQLSGGEGGDIDLSGYRTLDNDTFDYIRLVDEEGNTLLRMNAWGIGSDTNETFWIGADGTGAFTKGLNLDGKPVATQEWVNTAITNALAALDGSEVEY
jgi:hypothetical protein